jgi:hypothetical protein
MLHVALVALGTLTEPHAVPWMSAVQRTMLGCIEWAEAVVLAASSPSVSQGSRLT